MSNPLDLSQEPEVLAKAAAKKLKLKHSQKFRDAPPIFALVDPADYEDVARYTWRVRKEWRKNDVGEKAETLVPYASIDGRSISLPRYIMKAKGKEELVLHRDGDGRNCCRANLVIYLKEDERPW